MAPGRVLGRGWDPSLTRNIQKNKKNHSAPEGRSDQGTEALSLIDISNIHKLISINHSNYDHLTVSFTILRCSDI